MNKILTVVAAFLLAACQTASENTSLEQVDIAGPALAAALAAQDEKVQARYGARHPQETLEFFGVKPGMTVVEALPGGGWYSKILMHYLGTDGKLIGADYPIALYSNFGFATEDFLAKKETWVTDWSTDAAQWGIENGAKVDAFVIGDLPQTMQGTADVVLLVRALHNLARFSDETNFLGNTINDARAVLKTGGIVGVVQHHGSEDMPDDWATGANGYLKKSFVVEQFEANGFELLGESDVNANAKDQPSTEDFVWRLPPSLNVGGDNPELKEKYQAIGESNRMTLKFRKK